MRVYYVFVTLLITVLMSACSSLDPASTDQINVVVTTGIIGDAVQNVGGGHVRVTQLIGDGVDPHHYVLTDSDKQALADAQIVFYNGLGLEGSLTDVLKSFAKDKPVVAVAETISPDNILKITGTKTPDPHVWMNPQLWLSAVDAIREELSQLDPSTAATFRVNAVSYQSNLLALSKYIFDKINSLPPPQRVLVTAHDAFRYFAMAYGIDVYAPQDENEDPANGTDIQTVEQAIKTRGVTKIFAENGLPQDTLNTILSAVGPSVSIGGTLDTDSSGQPGTADGTYIDMMRYDVKTIVAAITGVPVN